MQYLNHHVWGRIQRINRKAAWIGICAVIIGLMSMLVVSASHEVTVFYDNSCQVVSAYNDNPRTIMEKAGIAYDGDEYELEETAGGMVLRISPVYTVTVEADGKVYRLSSRTDRVAYLLSLLGITLGAEDMVTPSPDTIITGDCTVWVQRVTYATALRQETLPPEIVYEDTDSLPKGTTAVKAKGIAGVKQVTYRDKLVDGQIAESTAVSETVLSAAVDEIQLRGTAESAGNDTPITTSASLNQKLISDLATAQPIAVNEKGQPLTYKKRITGTATAYTASEGNRTATGEVPQVGYIAVDPEEIPYGTMMYIKTADGSYYYGVAKAADTGGFITGSVTVDLFFATDAECIQFGVRDVEIYIL